MGSSLPQRRRHGLARDLKGVTFVSLGACAYLVFFSVFGTTGTRQHGTQHTSQAIFPRKVWQTWKVGAGSLGEREAVAVRSWHHHNPEHRHEIITDSNSLAYVRDVFGVARFNRPDIISVYTELKDHIVKADLLRYIMIYAEGGIYADVDVVAEAPFSEYIPKHINETDVDMIVGIETDEPAFKDHPILGPKAESICQWAFVAKPQHPVMLMLIESIADWLKRSAASQSKDIGQLEFNFDDVLVGSGPTAFTRTILAYLTAVTNRVVNWDDFHDLRDPKVVGRILILPAQAFAAGSQHSKSGSLFSNRALVKHLYGASRWTKGHLRHVNPLYGPVESCNWDRECVELWDMNVNQYKALSKDEQNKLIELKEKEGADVRG